MQDIGSCSNDNVDAGNPDNSLLKEEPQNLSSSGDSVKYDRENDDIAITSDITMANNYDSYFTIIKTHRFTSLLAILCLILALTLLVVVLQKNDSSTCACANGNIGPISTIHQSAYSMVGSTLASNSFKNNLSSSVSSFLVENDSPSTSYKISGSPDQTESHESNIKVTEYPTLQIPDTSDIKSSTTTVSGILTDSTITGTLTTSTPVSTITSSTPSSTTIGSPVLRKDNYELFEEDLNHLRNTFSCIPRLVKLSIFHAINDSTNAVTDNTLYPDVIAVMRCDHNNSFCCDTYGKESSDKHCTSIKNKIKTHRAWYHKDNKLVYEPIEIKEDLECICI